MTHRSSHSTGLQRTGRTLLPRLFMAALLVWPSGCQSMHLATRTFDAMPERQELALGARTYQAILDTHPRSPNAHLTQMLERVGQRLAAVSERPDFEWEFKLLSGPLQNAFCLPGGKVGVFEGILPACQNEAGLAVVLSHEIAHAMARHGGERLNHKLANEDISWSIGRVIGITDSHRIDMVKNVYGLESSHGVPLPYTRTQEAEADSIGLLLMARAGYDPNEAPRFWERLNRSSGEKTPELLATHPSDETRAAKLKEIVPRALSVYQGASQRYRLGEQIPMEALAELVPKPTPKPPEADKVAAAPAPAAAAVTPTPTVTPAPAAPAATPPAAATAAASPAPATAPPAATPPAATAAVTPAPADPAATPAPTTAEVAAATPETTPAPQNLTTVSVTPAPIVQVSTSTVTPAASPITTAILLNIGNPTIEGSASDLPVTADKPAPDSEESGGWQSYKK